MKSQKHVPLPAGAALHSAHKTASVKPCDGVEAVGKDPIAEIPLRTAVRFPIQLTLELITSHGTLEATTLDISANGILFTGPELPAVDSQIEFVLRMPGKIMGTTEDLTVHCVGRVVRHQQQGGQQQAAAIIDDYTMRM